MLHNDVKEQHVAQLCKTATCCTVSTTKQIQRRLYRKKVFKNVAMWTDADALEEVCDDTSGGRHNGVELFAPHEQACVTWCGRVKWCGRVTWCGRITWCGRVTWSFVVFFKINYNF